MSTPQYKAVGFNNTVMAIEKLAAPDRYRAFVAALPDASRALIEKPPLPSLWLPLARSKELLETAQRVAFAGDLRQLFEVGRVSQNEGIRTIYKVFVRLLRPDHIIGRAAQVWTTYYQDNGNARMERRDATTADLIVEGIRIPSPAYYEMLRGVTYAFGEATRVKDLASTIVDGGGHEPRCTFRVTWG